MQVQNTQPVSQPQQSQARAFESNQSVQTDEAPPDWLMPKVYKGSTKI